MGSILAAHLASAGYLGSALLRAAGELRKSAARACG
jgi:hypothetical protein